MIEWWTSLCVHRQALVLQWLDCSHEVSGFSGLCRSPGSASDKKSTLGAHRREVVHCLCQAPPVQHETETSSLLAPNASVRGSLVHAGFGFRKYCIPLRTRFWRSLIIEEFDDVAFLHEPGGACTLDGYVRYLWLSCSPLVLPGECVPVAPCRRAWMAPGGSH